MAENKKSFLLYCDLIHTVRKMPKDKVADLFLHILSYVNDENPTAEDMIIDLTFEPIKQQLKRDLKRYESIVERNRNNGKSGGRPKKEPKKPTGLSGNPKNPDEPKKADNDNDTDIDIYNTNKLTFDWEELIKYFNLATGKKCKVIPEKVKLAFKARLKEGYTKDDIASAITNCANSQFHKDNNHKNLTFEFISRSDKIDMYANQKPIKQTA